jgi:hypothetical protein
LIASAESGFQGRRQLLTDGLQHFSPVLCHRIGWITGHFTGDMTLTVGETLQDHPAQLSEGIMAEIVHPVTFQLLFVNGYSGRQCKIYWLIIPFHPHRVRFGAGSRRESVGTATPGV